MKIAFIRSVVVQQAAPYLMEVENVLHQYNVEAKLFFTDGDCSASDFPGATQKLPVNATAEEIAKEVYTWGATAAISLSIPDEQSLRDAAVRELLSRHGIRMVSHSLGASATFSNKWDTSQTLAKFGIRTVDGIFVDGDLLNGRNLAFPAYRDFIRQECRRLGYPLICKPLWNHLGKGIQYFRTIRDLEGYLEKPTDGNALIEKCIIGDLCSVEVIGQGDTFIAQPSIWKGRTSASAKSTFTLVRHNLSDAIAAEELSRIVENLKCLCRAIGVCGVVELELIYAEGVFYALEVNPRLSAGTPLAIASSGFNTYQALVYMALGRWTTFAATFTGRQRFALQFPYTRRKPGQLLAVGEGIDLVRGSSISIDNRDFLNAVISCKLPCQSSIFDWIDRHFDLDAAARATVLEHCEMAQRTLPQGAL